MGGYDDLASTASKIYDKAVEEHLSERYGIYKSGDMYYAPSDPHSYSSTMTQEQLQQAVDDTAQKFEDVPTLFDDFAVLPEPGYFTELITSVESCMGKLSSGQDGASDPITGRLFPFNTALKDMTTSADYLDEWDGLAVMEFIENFATPFPERCLNQFAAACVLVNALRAEQAIWEHARENIGSIADDTLSALEHKDDCGKNEWEIAFSVVGAVVAVGALTVASGGTAAIALGAVGAAASVGGTVVGQIDEPPKPRFSGETAEAVIDSCRKAIEDLKGYIKNAEDKVKSACENANGTLTAQSVDYVAPKPSILDQNRPDVGRPDSD